LKNLKSVRGKNSAPAAYAATSACNPIELVEQSRIEDEGCRIEDTGASGTTSLPQLRMLTPMLLRRCGYVVPK